MPLSPGYRALTEIWASSALANRTQPEDTSLTPPLNVEDGWPASFSAASGNRPRRTVFNWAMWVLTSALFDIRNHGVLPWDTDVDTLAGGVRQDGGKLWRATVDNGPTHTNAVQPGTMGDTVWEAITGQQAAPSQPRAPVATVPGSGELDWFWYPILDGGSLILDYSFEWRTAGQLNWPNSRTVQTARVVLTGLTNGQAIEARVTARNANGSSTPSTHGSGTPQGTIPGGGSTLALRAESGDGQVALGWLEPDDGGVSISSYTVQWRTDGQAFSTGRERTAADTMDTVPNLTNGTRYYFQVRAVNSQGNGAWSNEANATPVAVVVAPTPTPNTAPNAPPGLRGTPRRPLIVDLDWEIVSDDGGESDGGETILDYTVQWRYQGAGWSGNTTTTDRASLRVTVADTSKGVQARVRARNSVGSSAWSSTATVAAGDLLGAFPQVTRVSSDQTYSWPYPDAGRAVLRLHAEVGQSGRDAGSDFVVNHGTVTTMMSHGNTAWLEDNNDLLAYSNGSRNVAEDRDPAGVGNITTACTDGTTYWATGLLPDQTLRAHQISDDVAVVARNIVLGFSPGGAACDGTYIYALDNQNDVVQVHLAADGSRVTTRDIALTDGDIHVAIATNGTFVWAFNGTTDNAEAYRAVDGARSASDDIPTTGMTILGATIWGTTLWAFDSTGSPDHVRVWQLGEPTTVRVNGTTYTTNNTPVGDLWQPVTGLTQNEGLVIARDTGGYVDLYPQA